MIVSLIILIVAVGWCINAVIKLQKKVKDLEENEHDYVPENKTENIWRTKDDPLGLNI